SDATARISPCNITRLPASSRTGMTMESMAEGGIRKAEGGNDCQVQNTPVASGNQTPFRENQIASRTHRTYDDVMCGFFRLPSSAFRVCDAFPPPQQNPAPVRTCTRCGDHRC